MCITLWLAELTKFLHRLNLITTITVAGIFLVEGSPVKLLTFHTLPKREGTQGWRHGRRTLSVLQSGSACHIPRKLPLPQKIDMKIKTFVRQPWGTQKVTSGVQGWDCPPNWYLRLGRQRPPGTLLNFFMSHPRLWQEGEPYATSGSPKVRTGLIIRGPGAQQKVSPLLKN